jgi:hypothetical protein
MSDAEDEAHGQRVWREAHALLALVLDEIEGRSPSWPAAYADLARIVVPLRRPPATRWKDARTAFARDAHHLIDMSLRQDAEIVAANLTRLRAMLDAKFTHQDAFAAKVEPLRVAVQRLVAAHNGRIDADTADPLVTLRDALMQFDPLQAKAMLRELLRVDKYRFQGIVTSEDPTLQALARYLEEPQFALWRLDNPAAICGDVAVGHPERYTWFQDD